MTNEMGEAYIRWCRHRLLEHYWTRVQRCLTLLPPEDIWWRAHETNNSVGNLVVHLTGNIRQFILSSFGNMPDVRDKEAEFATREEISRESLLAGLETALRQADRVLQEFPAEKLLEKTTLHARERTYLEILAIVMEHFALHTGQIIFVTKLKIGKDPGF